MLVSKLQCEIPVPFSSNKHSVLMVSTTPFSCLSVDSDRENSGTVRTNYTTRKPSARRFASAQSVSTMNQSEGVKRSMSDPTVIDENGVLPPTTRHSIDYRISTSIFGRQVYFVFLSGFDQRSLHRVFADDELRPFPTYFLKFILVLFVLASAFLMLVGGAVVALYVLKSYVGIDIFDDHSVLHDLVF